MAEGGTKNKDADSSFVSVDVGGNQYDYAKSQTNLEFISGSYSENISIGSNSGSMKFATTPPQYSTDEHFIRHRGATASFLESKGFGWLLDSEVEDEDSKKPLLEELDIDLRDIYYKLRCVLLPLPQLGFNRQVVRESPDFWGPLVVVLVYALVSLYGQFSVVSWILTMWICGSCLIFVLARLLGGEVTFGQCLGVIGYSLLPLVIIGLFIPLVGQFYLASFCLQVVGVLWSTASAGSLLCGTELQSKRPLLLYPVFLLYVYFLSLYTGV